VTQRDNSFIYTEQSKNLYDFVLKHDNQIKRMDNDISNIKSQLLDIKMKLPINSQNNTSTSNFLSYDENNINKIIQIKEDIKNELMKDINNILIAQKSEMKQNFENLKQEFELYNDHKGNSNKILEINETLENLNQQMQQKDEEKNNLENIILNKINNDKIEINSITNNINKRIDSLDLDFDRLVQSLKNQFLTNANTLNQLEISKVNTTDFENQINSINQSLEVINNKLNSNNLQERNKVYKKAISKTEIYNNEDIIYDLNKKIADLKDEIYVDLEKINLKILNELKNQANDIRLLFQKFQYYEDPNKTISNKERDINLDYQKNVSLDN
jgi:chromosome segregation ATPase